MLSLKNYKLSHHLGFKLRTDRDFRRGFVELLFTFNLSDIELTKYVIDGIAQHFTMDLYSATSYTREIEQQLKKMMNDRKIIAFIRLVQSAVKFEGNARVDENCWFRRFQNLKFSDDTGIDLFSISETIFELSQFYVFDDLSSQQRFLLEQLNIEEIDLLSNFTPTGIHLLSKITRLSEKSRSFLLSLKAEEGILMNYFGFEGIRLISYISGPVRDSVIQFADKAPEKQRMFLNWFPYMNTSAGKRCLERIADLEREERIVLQTLIDKKGEIVKNLSEVEEMDWFFDNIRNLSEKDRETFWFLDQQQYNVLQNLSEIDRNILNELDERVLKISSTLTETELNQLLFLPKNAMKTISNKFFKNYIYALARFFPKSQPISPRIVRLEEEKEIVLQRLNQNQRIVLAQVYKLSSSGVQILLDLDLNQLNRVLNPFKILSNLKIELSRSERFLSKKLKDLSPRDRYNIVHMTNEEWISFYTLRNFNDQTRNVLINLSGSDIVVLQRMVFLNTEQLSFVKNTSETGLAVLAGNSQLTPKMINFIMQLSKEEEKKLLLNLDLNSRFVFKYEEELTSVGKQLMREMNKLDEQEIFWTKLLNFDGQFKFTDEEIQFCTHLTENGVKVLTDLIESINSDKKSIFNIWKLMFDKNIKHDELNIKFETEISEWVQSNPGAGSKFLANVIAVSRFEGNRGLNILETSNDFDQVFFMELLRLSLEGGLDNADLLNIVDTIYKKEFNPEALGRVYDWSDRQQIELLKFILINSLNDEYDILHKLARAILFDHLYGNNSLVLDKIIYPRTERVIQALRIQLTKDQNFLAVSLFFNSEDDRSIATWLSQVLDSPQCYDLLNSRVRKNNPTLPYISKILLTYEFDHVAVIEISAYYGRGDTVPLLSTLPELDLIKLLGTKSGEKFFNACLTNGKVSFLRFLYRRLNRYMKNFVKKDNYRIVKNLIDTVISAEQAQDLATMLHMFYEIDPSIPKHVYIQTSSKLIIDAQRVAPPEIMASIVRSLITDSITLEDLIDRLMDDLNLQTRYLLFNVTRNSCNFTNQKNNVYTPCIDSRDRRKITEEMVDILNKETVVDITFYNDLSKYTTLVVARNSIDPQFKRSFGEKVRNVELDSLDPNIHEIVMNLKDGLGKRNSWQNELMKIGVVEKIRRAQDTASCAFIVSFLNRRFSSNRFDSWFSPKINETIRFPEILNLGKGIENFFNDPGEGKLPDLFIMSHSFFVAMDLSAPGVKSATILNSHGMVGSVAVFHTSDFLQAKIRVDLDHMKRTDIEKSQSHWSMLNSNEASVLETSDFGVENVFERYISLVVDKFSAKYDRVGISLPRWIKGKTDYYQRTQDDEDKTSCVLKTISSPIKLIFDRQAVVWNEFVEHAVSPHSTLMPERLKDFHLICSPSSSRIENETIIQNVSPNFYQFCHSESNESHSRVSTERYRLHGNNNDRCQNMVLYEKDEPSKSKKTILYIQQDHITYVNREFSQDDVMDVIFFGSTINIVDSKSRIDPWVTPNNYVFKNALSKCKIHKEGLNIFHTKDNELICDLNGSINGQDNVVVIQNDFVDSENIHSVIGYERKNKITISYANFVDGGGGYDNIFAGNLTVVKAHSGDLITGRATVVVPESIAQIDSIRIEPSTFILSNTQGTFIEMEKTGKFITEDGYFIVPIQKSGKTEQVWGMLLYKRSQVDITFEVELAELRQIENKRFDFIKQVSSPHRDIILTEMNDNVFVIDKNSHNYYWEAVSGGRNLYILSKPNGNVTISRANGILDFRALNITIDAIAISNTNNSINIDNEDLHISLLKNHRYVGVTFNGKEYYKLAIGMLNRDFCSHPIEVEGKISIHYSDLIDNHKCFCFRSDEAYFINSNKDLIIVSGTGALLLQNYYSSVRQSLNSSLKLNYRITTPEEFQMRVNNPSRIKYYQVGKQGLQIYHNEPENKHDIGFVDLKQWSIVDCRAEFFLNALLIRLILHRDEIILKVENWTTHPPTRKIIFSFKDKTFFNTACIVSNCSPKYILDEFEEVQPRPNDQFNTRSCVVNNLGFLFYVFQSFLDKHYPLPAERSTSTIEILADACNITQTFEDAIKITAQEFHVSIEEIDFFHVYTNVTNFIRQEKYLKIMETFDSIVEKVGLDNQAFVHTLKQNVNRIIFHLE